MLQKTYIYFEVLNRFINGQSELTF